MDRYHDRLKKIKLGLLPRDAVPKPRKRIPKISEKKKRQMELIKEDEMGKWFADRRQELRGVCMFCGKQTTKNDAMYWKAAIAHLLPKKKRGGFPSVECHPDNYLELCHWGNSCHQNFDNGMITWASLKGSKVWDVIVSKFKRIYPFIAETEKRNIPDILLAEIQSPEKI